MAFERLKKFAAKIRPAELALVQLVAVVCVLLSAAPLPVRVSGPIVGFTEADEATFAVARPEGAEWSGVHVYEIPVPDRTAWVDWTIPVEMLDRDGPLAVSMQGPFSATVYFNGVEIGEKGVPANTASEETAGSIDASFAIPDALIRENQNRIAMRISAGRAGYTPAAVIQSLRIAPYRADQRRDLRYYAPALLFSGGLFGVALGFVRLARARNDGRLYWGSVGLGGLVLAVAAEISRSVVNYPYDWHQPRQVVIGAGLCLFGFAVLRFVMLRWPTSKRTVRTAMGGAAISVAVVWLAVTGYDAKSAISSAALLFGAAVWAGVLGGRKDIRALAFSLALISFPFMMLVAPADYLDRSIYMLAVCLFGYALLRAPDFLSPLVAAPEEIKTLSVSSGAQTYFVPIDAISMVKAAGNYSEVHQENGEWKLDSRGLTELSKKLPAHFFRIHRSYIANLAHASRLTSEEGSRYWLDLTNGERMPVSRTKVKALREAMGSTPSE